MDKHFGKEKIGKLQCLIKLLYKNNIQITSYFSITALTLLLHLAIILILAIIEDGMTLLNRSFGSGRLWLNFWLS